MTPTQADRDRLADILYKFTDYNAITGTQMRFSRWVHRRHGKESVHHPIRDNDLNALAAIWAEELKGWEWVRICVGRERKKLWSGGKTTDRGFGNVGVPDTDNFYCDFLALTLACLEQREGRRVATGVGIVERPSSPPSPPNSPWVRDTVKHCHRSELNERH